MKWMLPLGLLCGCACQKPLAVPVDVEVPVAVGCGVAIAREPQWNIPRLSADSTAVDKVRAALADLELSRGYIDELKAERDSCS